MFIVFVVIEYSRFLALPFFLCCHQLKKLKLKAVRQIQLSPMASNRKLPPMSEESVQMHHMIKSLKNQQRTKKSDAP